MKIIINGKLTNLTDQNNISRFLDGEMTASELQYFEQRLLSDKKLQEALEIEKEMRFFVSNNEDIEKGMQVIQQVGQEYAEEKSAATNVIPMYIRRALGIAAAIALLLIANVFRPQPSVVQQYFTIPTASFLQKGPIDQKDLATYETLINQKQYVEALTALNKLSQEDLKKNTELLFYKGLLMMQLERWQEAQPILESVVTQDEVFRHDVNWYLALIMIEQKNNERAMQLLQTLERTSYADRAGDIIAGLKK